MLHSSEIFVIHAYLWLEASFTAVTGSCVKAPWLELEIHSNKGPDWNKKSRHASNLVEEH